MTERTLAQLALEFANKAGWEFYSTNEFPGLMAAFARSIVEKEAAILKDFADEYKEEGDGRAAQALRFAARSMKERSGIEK